MQPRERDLLDAALLDARRKGLRVFCCFGCGDWFVQTGVNGRRRRACDDPWCLWMFRHWKRYGRLPGRDSARRMHCYIRAAAALLPVRPLFRWSEAA